MSQRTGASHLAARFSVVAGFVCFIGNCLANRVIARQGFATAGWIGQVIGWLTMLVVLAGIGLAIVGLVDGRRRRASETIGVALIGLLLNLGIVALTFYGLWVIAQAGR